LLLLVGVVVAGGVAVRAVWRKMQIESE